MNAAFSGRKSGIFFIMAREPVKIWSEAEYFHNKPPAMRVVGKAYSKINFPPKRYNKIVQVYCITPRRKVNGKYKRFVKSYKMAM